MQHAGRGNEKERGAGEEEEEDEEDAVEDFLDNI